MLWHAGVRRQVFCEWNTHTRTKKERKLLSGENPPAFSGERLPPTHTPLQWANYTHVLWTVKLNWLKIGPVHLISKRKKWVWSKLVWLTTTEAYHLPQNFYLLPCSAWEVTQWYYFLFGKYFPVCTESVILAKWVFWTMNQFTAVALRSSAIQRWHSFLWYLMLAAAMVSVTGTNYQCQIMILKKRLMLARDQTQIKART